MNKSESNVDKEKIFNSDNNRYQTNKNLENIIIQNFN